jgi:pyruvate dehydrogenase E2 component (dihydrolipoamide acetyltransferase)
METGTIATWKVKEGDSFAAGDSLAEIETDKASIDFEAQDDGVVAKLLVKAGTADIAVGKPIMVTVEDKDDVAAFSNFVPEDDSASASATSTSEPATPLKETPVTKPAAVVESVPKSVAAPVATISPKPIVEAPAVEVPIQNSSVDTSAVSPVSNVGVAWGNFARVRSSLAAVLSASQKKYIETYGSTGQMPL